MTISARRASSSRWDRAGRPRARPDAPRRRTANSSPPRRATESPSRTQPTSRSATVFSSSSPAACPKRSLTDLKPSRSRNSTAICVLLPARPGDRLLDPVEEERAVGQPGERVVPGQPAHLLDHRQPGERLLADRRQRLQGLPVGVDRGAGPVAGGRDQPQVAAPGADPGADLAVAGRPLARRSAPPLTTTDRACVRSMLQQRRGGSAPPGPRRRPRTAQPAGAGARCRGTGRGSRPGW